MSDIQVAVDGLARVAGTARNETIRLMVEHMSRDHELGPYTIARRLGLRVNDVKNMINELERR